VKRLVLGVIKVDLTTTFDFVVKGYNLKGVDTGGVGVERRALAVGPDVVVGIPRGEALAGAILDIAYPCSTGTESVGF